MKKLFFTILTFITISLQAQEVIWDQGIPVFQGDKYIDSLVEKIDLAKVRDNEKYELSTKEKAICVEIGLALYSRKEFDAANWYFNKSIGTLTESVESRVPADKEFVYLIKEVQVPAKVEEKKEESEIAEMKKDLNFLKTIPKSFENLSKKDLSSLKEQLQKQINKLILEKDSLLKAEASQEVIDAKDGAIKTLKKESQIIDLTIQNDDLNVENKDLTVQKKELRKYLTWACVGLSIMVLLTLVLLQRKTIKVKDNEILKQLYDINKKNTYLEHAAKMIRHDMHSGINTYMPRGIASLEKRMTPEQITELKIEAPLKMIKEGLNHTQRVYKGVYEFTNLVKKDVVLNKQELDLKELLTRYLKNTSYISQVTIEDLGNAEVNETLFCNAIDNLIRNGLKYNNNESKFVKVSREGNYLIVQDNGVGMSQKEFENHTSHNNPELGLGIGICMTILKEHGFSATCEKNNIGTKIKIKVT